MINSVKRYSLIALLSCLIYSCSDYSKVLKSDDYEYQYERAVQYYKDGSFNKAIALLKTHVRIYRGTSKAAEVNYYYAKSYFGNENYYMASYYFKTLLVEFPRSKYSEEAQFMIGYCGYLQSPVPKLDQSGTESAIDAFNLFVNLYPDSEYVDKANEMIDEMMEKLLYKSYLNAKLYYDMEDYKASVISLASSLKDFPQTSYREELMFMLLSAKFKYADLSIASKRKERFNDALDQYFSFSDEFENSRFSAESEGMFEKIKKALNITDEDLKITLD